METQFEEVIATRERLRELSKQPSQRASNKIIDHIDEICRRFIAACPFVIVASRGADGRIELSPKGDPPGFVAVLDDKTLAIPDRPGNHRLDTFENLLAHPEVGLIFVIPGNGDTLRVSGKRADRARPLLAGAPGGRWQSPEPRPYRHRRGGLHALPQMHRAISAVDARALARSFVSTLARRGNRGARKAPGRRHASAGHHR